MLFFTLWKYACPQVSAGANPFHDLLINKNNKISQRKIGSTKITTIRELNKSIIVPYALVFFTNYPDENKKFNTHLFNKLNPIDHVVNEAIFHTINYVEREQICHVDILSSIVQIKEHKG